MTRLLPLEYARHWRLELCLDDLKTTLGWRLSNA